MKASIHPTYYPDTKVTCSCGQSFELGSTLQTIQVDICSKCHPFFTGEMRFVDTQGRVERFQAKMKQAETRLKEAKAKKLQNKQIEKERQNPQTLKEMLEQVKSSTPKQK